MLRSEFLKRVFSGLLALVGVKATPSSAESLGEGPWCAWCGEPVDINTSVPVAYNVIRQQHECAQCYSAYLSSRAKFTSPARDKEEERAREAADVIYRIEPSGDAFGGGPFTGVSDSRYFEWQTDELRPPSAMEREEDRQWAWLGKKMRCDLDEYILGSIDGDA